jgi:tetratricopeptide (TPR) repeat protein
LAQSVALALVLRADLLDGRGEHARAMKDRDEVIERVQRSGARELRARGAMALFGNAKALYSRGRYDEALKALDVLLDDYGDVRLPSTSFASRLDALRFRAMCLEALDRVEEAISQNTQAILEYADEHTPAARRVVAGSLLANTALLIRAGRWEESIATADQLLARFGTETEAALRDDVAGALHNKILSLLKLERVDEASVVLNGLIGRFQAETDTALLAATADSLLRLGTILASRGDIGTAIDAFDALGKLGHAEQPELQRRAIHAAIRRSGAMIARGDVDAGSNSFEQLLSLGEPALGALDDFIANEGRGAHVDEITAAALLAKITVLRQLERDQDANSLLESVNHRYGDHPSPLIQQLLATTDERPGEPPNAS